MSRTAPAPSTSAAANTALPNVISVRPPRRRRKTPPPGSGWLRLTTGCSRFDLADRAYQNAIQLSGETVQILNNQGYSYMLRGNLVSARAKFAKARALEPGNPLMNNNMKLLQDGAKYVRPNPL